ncbi:MAG: ABC transporter substrate-binding protein [Dehalococcoidia bacterium]
MQTGPSTRAFVRRRAGSFVLATACLLGAACSSSNNNSANNKPSGAASVTQAPASTAASATRAAPSPATGSTQAAGTARPASSPATAAGSPTQAAAARAANLSPIKLGVMDDLASSTAIEGAEMRINTDLAVQTINAAGGINGHPLQVTYVDTKADPAVAVSAATQLAQQDKVDVLIGGVLSSECLAVQDLAPKLGIVYMASTGCASDAFTGQSCNKDSFRIQPAGSMVAGSVGKFIVQTYGKRWAIIYPDYAFGQSQLAAYTAAIEKAGGTITTKIPVPLGEANVTPYVTKIPLDGSVDGLINSEIGTDLARVTAVMDQFGVTKKLAVAGAGGKERFGGVYPDSLTGSIFAQGTLSDPSPDNKLDQAYVAAFKAQAAKEGSVAAALGGADKAVPGELGYQAWGVIMALKNAMITSKFTGRADTDKLIAALETLNLPQSADFPAGPFIMSKTDHQGRWPILIMKINGQKEDILQTIPADQVPLIANCKV